MIQSLDRGIRILSILADKESMSIKEIAEYLQVDKSTASRLVDTLKLNDMVQKNQLTGKYKLGLRVLYLSESLKNSLNILLIAKPILQEVSEELKESIHLCTYNNGTAYIIDQVRSSKEYKLFANVGMIEPLHSSSVGKCILAFKTKDRIDEILKDYDFVKYTDNTITNKEDLLKELDIIRRQGFAEDNEEVAKGVSCIAAPVFDYRNTVKYSVGISGPTNNKTLREKQLYINKLIETARRISKELGYGFANNNT